MFDVLGRRVSDLSYYEGDLRCEKLPLEYGTHKKHVQVGLQLAAVYCLIKKCNRNYKRDPALCCLQVHS